MTDEVAVPKGWTLSTIDDVTSHVTDGTHMPPARAASGVPLLSAKDIVDGGIQPSESRFVSEAYFLSELERTRLEQGDVLVTIVGSIGRTAVVPPDPRFALQRSVAILKPTARVLPRYLSYYLRSPQAMAYYREKGRGTAQQGLYLRELKRLPILLPSLADQQLVADLIDAAEASRTSALGHLAFARTAFDRFRQAVLGAACSGRLTADWREDHPSLGHSAYELLRGLQAPNGKPFDHGSLVDAFPGLPETWRVVAGAEAFTFVTSGSRGWAKYYSDEGPAFLRVGNLDRHRLDLDLTAVQAVTPPSSAESKRTRVQPGDLLISITAEVGMVGVVPADLGEGYVNQHVAIARPHPHLNSRYLAAFVAAPFYGKSQLDSLQRGATKAGLGLDDIRALRIPLPPPEEQVEIARRVDQFMSAADSLDSRIDAASHRIDRSSQAVLAKAFRGELLPTGGDS